jgi:hypothetical protein
MDTNITIPKKEIAPGVFTTGGTATIPNVITPQALAPQPKVDLTGTVVTPQNGSDVVSGASSSALGFDADYQRMLGLQAQPQAESDTMSKLLADITGAEEGLTGRGETQLATENQLGISELSKRRAETTQPRLKSALAEYQALKTEFEQMSADIEAGAGRKGLTTGAVMGQQGAIDRAKLARLNSKASEIGLIEAEDLAIKGQIDEAQKRADRAVDLLFADREATYNTKLNQYNRVKEFLTEEEKKRGKALEYALGKEKEKIDAEKEQAKSIEKMLLEATPNAPANIISNAKAIKDKGGSALEVAQALGKYGGDYLKTELLKQQIETEKAQRSKIYSDIAKTKAEADKAKAEATTTPEAQNKILDQVNFLKSTLASAKALSGASGRSGGRKFVENIAVGATDYTRLKQFTDTLATNILTLSSDPNIKKFFGPQMTENDVKMMIASGTVLNPENNSPEDYLAEAQRLEGLVKKMEDAVLSKSPEGQYVDNIVSNALMNSSNTQMSPNAYINSLK